MATLQGAGAWVLNEWTEVYRLAFAGLADLTGGTSDAGTMALGSVTWTRRNTSAAYLDSLNIASGKLVWDLSSTSSTTDLETAATGPLLRTLINNISTVAAAQVSPYTPLRWACAVTDLGDENTELIGLGILGAASSTGRAISLETGFVAGAAKTQWSTYSPSKITCSTAALAATATALMVEMHGAHFIPYYGTAVNAEPPPINDDSAWTALPACSLTTYAANQNADYLYSSTLGQLFLHAANGNTDNDFAPAHTGIALGFARNAVLY